VIYEACDKFIPLSGKRGGGKGKKRADVRSSSPPHLWEKKGKGGRKREPQTSRTEFDLDYSTFTLRKGKEKKRKEEKKKEGKKKTCAAPPIGPGSKKKKGGKEKRGRGKKRDGGKAG